MLLLALFMTVGVRAQQQQEQPTLEFVMELRVTDNDGKTSVTNIRLTEEDVETIGILKELRGEN